MKKKLATAVLTALVLAGATAAPASAATGSPKHPDNLCRYFPIFCK